MTCGHCALEVAPPKSSLAVTLRPSNGAEEVSTREGMDGVRDELKKLRLDEYANEFEAHGYDVWMEVLRLPPHRLEKMCELVGLDNRPNHADRFKEQIRDQRKRLGVRQVMPKGHNGASGDEGCVIL